MYCAIKYCAMQHRIMTLQKKINAETERMFWKRKNLNWSLNNV